MLVTVKRQRCADAMPYTQTFSYTGERGRRTVMTLLRELNEREPLTDIHGQSADPICYECSCSQSLCGACAMRINGRPALACAVFLCDIEGDEVILEPLSRFPVIRDLCVDRGSIEEMLCHLRVFTDTPSTVNMAEHRHLYAIGRCLRCGLCLEVCPSCGSEENSLGAPVLNDIYRICVEYPQRREMMLSMLTQCETDRCAGGNACVNVCPLHVPTPASLAKLCSMIDKKCK